jgi:hypothetical protein
MFGLGLPELVILACLGLLLIGGVLYLFMRGRN